MPLSLGGGDGLALSLNKPPWLPHLALRGPSETDMDTPLGSRLGQVCGLGFIRKKQNSGGWDIDFGVLKDE